MGAILESSVIKQGLGHVCGWVRREVGKVAVLELADRVSELIRL